MKMSTYYSTAASEMSLLCCYKWTILGEIGLDADHEIKVKFGALLLIRSHSCSARSWQVMGSKTRLGCHFLHTLIFFEISTVTRCDIAHYN